ncbi:MAG: hypothetical protein ACI8PZ_001136 [Myxococcota bacterium]|jgi:hypothetical protein
MVWLLLAASAFAGCDLPSLRSALAEAETAFAELDSDTFSTAATDAGYTLSCLEEAMTPVDAASYHRLKALKAFIDGQPADTTGAFAAVLATQPGYQLPDPLAPPGHPLRAAFEAAGQLADLGTFDLPQPGQGWVQIDGRRVLAAPAGRPWVFQKFDRAGEVESSAWVPSGGSFPDYPGPEVAPAPVPVVAAPPSIAPVAPPQPTAKGSPAKRALRGAGIGLAVASLAAYGGAFAAKNQYDGAVFDGDEKRIRSLHGVTNGLTIGAVSGAGVSLTLLVTGLL